LLLNTVRRDGNRVRIGFSQDPGQAGRARHFIWCGFTVSPAPQSGDNLTRFGPLRSRAGRATWRSCAGPGTRNCSASSKASPISPWRRGRCQQRSLENAQSSDEKLGLYELYRKQAEQLRVEKGGSW